MEQDPNKAQEASGRDTERKSDASSFSSSVSRRTSADYSLTHNAYMRSASLNRIGNTNSFQRGPISLSRGGSGLSQDSLSRRRGSSSLSRDASDQILERIRLSRDLTDELLGYVDSSTIAQVGDSGDRVVEDDREDIYVDSSAIAQVRDSGDRVVEDDREDDKRLFLGEANDVEKGVTNLPDDALDDALILSRRFRSGSLGANLPSPVSPLAEKIISPLPTDAILHSTDKSQMQTKERQYKLPKRLDYISYLIHLAVFGILGALTRYLLQKLFGPNRLALTGDNTPLYLDLPSNMLGSFLMGWFGIVFKTDIRHISDHVVVGLTTGYMGSLTTFSGWNQKMLDLSSKGHWVFAIAGIIIGMFIVNESIRIGVESAEWLRSILLDWLEQCSERIRCSLEQWRVDSLKRHLVVMIFMLMMLGLLWGLSGALARRKFNTVTNGAVLWLGCLVGPPGVWTRWYLARLNGQGLGKKGLLKWLPIGTLSANVLAACLMAALATISKAVNTKRCGILVSGIQFGFLGCLSTVSTFVAEVYALRQSGHSGRALAYTAATILPSFAMGTLIYSVPVWTKHYK